jgi:hypothetical protein
MRLNNRREAFVFWYGAIAQLGERVLCKHEVVGSIPSGSTRWLIEDRRSCLVHTVRETSLRTLYPTGCGCGISDIVKRRLIRVWDLAKQFAGSQSLSPGRFGARSSQGERVVNVLVGEA